MHVKPHPHMPKSLPDSLIAALIELQLAAHFKHRFRSNDIVQIDERGGIRVNGATLCGLKAQDFIVLRILALHAHAHPGDPISVPEIIAAVRADSLAPNSLGLSWVDPHDKVIHDAVYRLRQALKNVGLNIALIERISRKGYRLSTPATNILLSVQTGGSGGLRAQTPRSPRVRKKERVGSGTVEKPANS